MFRYDDTNRQSKPKEKQIKRVSEVRRVTYITHYPIDRNKMDRDRVPDIQETEGYEIVREVVVDPRSTVQYPPPLVVENKTVEFHSSKRRKKQEVSREE